MSATIPASSASAPDGVRPRARASESKGTRLRPLRRRRNLPWLIVGLVLVIACALAFAVTSLRLGGREPVLALAHRVPAGHVLAPADLRVVNVAAPELGLIPRRAAPRVTGRTTAVPLHGGALLTEKALGPASYPPEGQAVVAAALQTGAFPPSLGPGARVAVVVTAGEGASVAQGRASPNGAVPSSARVLEATVTSVTATRQQARGSTVVSLRLPRRQATTVAAAAGEQRVHLVLLPPGGGDQE